MPTSQMYDSTNPAAIPRTKYLAVYFNGKFKADLVQVMREHPGARVYCIDVLTNAYAQCSILDVETGDAKPSDVPLWVEDRLRQHPDSLCRLYCNKSTWGAVKTEVAKLSESDRKHVRYWVADPTGEAHIPDGADACQYLWTNSFDLSLCWDSFH